MRNSQDSRRSEVGSEGQESGRRDQGGALGKRAAC